jgi:two-component system, chemotaxis family, protein-glutamate methylesterase/glutaminase
MAPVRVLIVDDSAAMRHLLQALLAGFRDIQVVGTAADAYIARDKIKELRPDVITLDIELPRMSGLEFLERLMRLKPMPVVMVSSLTEVDAEPTLRALELGAVDFIAKPKQLGQQALGVYAEELANKIRGAAGADVRRLDLVHATWLSRSRAEPSPTLVRRAGHDKRIIVIGASTGGTEALREVLSQMPDGVPPVFVVQHMPEFFTSMFARRLDQICRIEVTEASHDEVARPGVAYIAPGHSHMEVVRRGTQYAIQLNQGEFVNRHRPSVDVLFASALRAAAVETIGVLLTGMGADGAAGMVALRTLGAHTIAQNEETSVIFGMPRAAIDQGGASEVLPIQRIGRRIVELLEAPARKPE